MSIVKDVLGGASGLIKSIGDAVDRNITNTGEKMALLNDLQKLINENEREITSRHAADMASDSWLSKNVRPLILISLMGLFVIFSMLDGFGLFSLNNGYVDMLNQLCSMVIAFYFGSRGIEKVFRTIKK